jgi:hypothetical protein
MPPLTTKKKSLAEALRTAPPGANGAHSPTVPGRRRLADILREAMRGTDPIEIGHSDYTPVPKTKPQIELT